MFWQRHGIRKESRTMNNKKQLYVSGIKLQECDRFAHLNVERRFKCKLFTEAKGEPNQIIVDAMVLDNNICVLMIPMALDAKKLVFNENISGNIIYGKLKKGARHLNAGEELCQITLADDSVLTLKTPISGKLLEMNDRLTELPGLLGIEQYRNEGFICILSSEAPKIMERSLSTANELSLDDMIGKEQVCFGWLKGTCTRGDVCKFKHFRQSASSDVVAN